jgi:hypothetical protein
MLKWTVVAALILPPLFTLMAQENMKVQEPEYVHVVLSLDPATGALQPLERQKLNVSGKLKAFGLGGATSKVIFEGAKSPIRFKADQKIQFVVRGLSAGIEPDSQVNLDVLTSSKNERGIVTMKVGLLSGAKTTMGQTLRPLTFSKYGEQSTKFSPEQPLEPGEYVITTKGGSTGFLFGIDPK